MEADRFWTPESGGLDIRAQRAFSFAIGWKHESGFKETRYIHIPYDTFLQLVRFRADVIVAGEFGFRTLGAALYRLFARRTRLVIWATLSEHTELGRSAFRLALRRFLIKASDAIMTNGRSGARYLESLGARRERVFVVPQTTDVRAFASVPLERSGPAARRLLYSGRLLPRKRVDLFLKILGAWAARHPSTNIEMWIAGDGPERAALEGVPLPSNVKLKCLGNVPYSDLPGIYAEAGALVIPTLADEWALVVNEGLAAGAVVLGSTYSQAVQDLVEDGVNGWTYRVDVEAEVTRAIDCFFSTGEPELSRMRAAARATALKWSPEAVVDRMALAVQSTSPNPRP